MHQISQLSIIHDSQRMEHTTSMELEQNPHTSPKNQIQHSTPSKQHNKNTSLGLPPKQEQMMLIQTPVKQQSRFMDSFLQSEQRKYQYSLNEHFQKLEEEIDENIFDDDESEDIQNIQPNIQIQQPKIGLHSKPPQTVIYEQVQFNNSTFKTPGRSSKTYAISTNKKKPCTCKKSGCLKKYCECFKSGQVCGEDCDCIGCKNTDFANLKTKTQSSTKEVQTTCNCRKSNCLKGYCDCHAAGKICSQLCNCVDCKNVVMATSQFSLAHTSKRPRRVRWSQDYGDLQYELN